MYVRTARLHLLKPDFSSTHTFRRRFKNVLEMVHKNKNKKNISL